MRFEPGFARDLRESLKLVPDEIRQRVDRPGGLHTDVFYYVACEFSPVDATSDEHVAEKDVSLPQENWKSGAAAVRANRVAFVTLADDRIFMKTPRLGLHLTVHKRIQAYETTPEGETLNARSWFLAPAGEKARRLVHQMCGVISPMQQPGIVIEHFETYKMKPDHSLSHDENGHVELCPSGSGDFPAALEENDLLDEVDYYFVVSGSNMLAAMDLKLLSQHIDSGKAVTCEVIPRHSEDGGAIPVWRENNVCLVDDYTLNSSFVDGAKYTSTGTMIISAQALKELVEEDKHQRNFWKWHRVRKYENNQVYLQFKRSLFQITERLSTNCVLVDRDKRYFPIRNEFDLERADDLLDYEKARWGAK